MSLILAWNESRSRQLPLPAQGATRAHNSESQFGKINFISIRQPCQPDDLDNKLMIGSLLWEDVYASRLSNLATRLSSFAIHQPCQPDASDNTWMIGSSLWESVLVNEALEIKGAARISLSAAYSHASRHEPWPRGPSSSWSSPQSYSLELVTGTSVNVETWKLDVPDSWEDLAEEEEVPMSCLVVLGSVQGPLGTVQGPLGWVCPGTPQLGLSRDHGSVQGPHALLSSASGSSIPPALISTSSSSLVVRCIDGSTPPSTSPSPRPSTVEAASFGSDGDCVKILVVRNIPFAFTVQKLRDLMDSLVIPYVFLHVPRGSDSNGQSQCKGFAFVGVTSSHVASSRAALDGLNLQRRPVKTEISDKSFAELKLGLQHLKCLTSWAPLILA
jgi:hypothetical protein